MMEEKKKTYTVIATDINGERHKVEMEAHDDSQLIYDPNKFYFSADQESNLKRIVDDMWVSEVPHRTDVDPDFGNGWKVTVCYEGECHCGLKDE